MQVTIEHTTVYSYAEAARQAVQELRLTPQDTRSQKVLGWKIEMPGIAGAPSWRDAWGNIVHLTAQHGDHAELAIRVTGQVLTNNTDGIIGNLPHAPTPRIFTRATPLTAADRAIDTLATGFRGRHRDQIALYHALMGSITERMRFDASATDAATSAAEALKAGHGVCQDFAHIFIAVCRRLDMPARYVTGYLVLKGGGEAEAHHAWVEADVAGLGWVGFDPVNGICPDERYVRLACGLDADTAAPVRGVRRGSGGDRMAVRVSVREQFQQ